jgi:transcriptional regulator of acetoin/glycerol metabolism
MAMEAGDYITLPVLAQFIDLESAEEETTAQAGSVPEMETEYTSSLARFEKDYLKRLLKKARGNVEAAARASGMNMATIYRKLKKYGIDKGNF